MSQEDGAVPASSGPGAAPASSGLTSPTAVGVLGDGQLSPAGAADRDQENGVAGGDQDGHQFTPQIYGKTGGVAPGQGQGNTSIIAAEDEICATEPVETENKEDEAVTAARAVSVVSLLVSLIAACLGLGIGFREEMLSLVGFGTEALLDGLSSALVLWRFKRPKLRPHENPQEAAARKAERDVLRERNSSIGIGATFLALSVLLLFSAGWKALEWDPNTAVHRKEEHLGAFYSVLLSFPSCAVFGGLAYWKFSLARSLGSQVLHKDALCSVLGALLAAIVACAGLMELGASNTSDDMALVDAAASAVIALILGVEGGRTLLHNLPGGTWEVEHRQMS